MTKKNKTLKSSKSSTEVLSIQKSMQDMSLTNELTHNCKPNEFIVLTGHKKAITCMDHQWNNSKHEKSSILASGSEDGSIRLWDVRERATSKTIKCFLCDSSCSIESIKFHPKKSDLLYAASKNHILTYDLRMEGVLIKTSMNDIAIIAEDNDDTNEINTIDIHPKGNYFAVGDDNGNTYILTMSSSSSPLITPLLTSITGEKYKTLNRLHTSIIGSIMFKPNSSNEIATSSFDCCVGSWDFNRGRVLSNFSFTNNELFSKDQGQVFNPPFVQCIKYTQDGKFLIVGLGNGQLSVLRANDISFICSIEAHNAMISSIYIIDDIIFSASCDRYLKAWRLVSNEDIIDKTKVIRYTLELLWQEFHGRKINTIIASHEEIFVGDTSNSIRKYYTNH